MQRHALSYRQRCCLVQFSLPVMIVFAWLLMSFRSNRLTIHEFQRDQIFLHFESCYDKALNELDQDSECLLKRLESNHVLLPPPVPSISKLSMNKPYDEISRGEAGQPLVIDEIFNHMENGFFVEVGAADGEHASNTFHLEYNRNWSGILGEANPDFFTQLQAKHRPRSILFKGCLSVKTTPDVVQFDAANYRGGIINKDQEGSALMKPGDSAGKYIFPNRKTISVQCYPLFALLKSLGNPTVDFLSLDVEGAELPILRTIPFDKVNIRVLLVELRFAGKMFSGSKNEIIRLLHENGYDLLGGVHRDGIFVRRGDGGLSAVTRQSLAGVAAQVGAMPADPDVAACVEGEC